MSEQQKHIEALKEIECLRASLVVAMHDIERLHQDAALKPQGPKAEYGQCAHCGVFSSAAKALHDARRCARGGEE